MGSQAPEGERHTHTRHGSRKLNQRVRVRVWVSHYHCSCTSAHTLRGGEEVEARDTPTRAEKSRISDTCFVQHGAMRSRDPRKCVAQRGIRVRVCGTGPVLTCSHLRINLMRRSPRLRRSSSCHTPSRCALHHNHKHNKSHTERETQGTWCVSVCVCVVFSVHVCPSSPCTGTCTPPYIFSMVASTTPCECVPLTRGVASTVSSL